MAETPEQGEQKQPEVAQPEAENQETQEQKQAVGYGFEDPAVKKRMGEMAYQKNSLQKELEQTKQELEAWRQRQNQLAQPDTRTPAQQQMDDTFVTEEDIKWGQAVFKPAVQGLESRLMSLEDRIKRDEFWGQGRWVNESSEFKNQVEQLVHETKRQNPGAEVSREYIAAFVKGQMALAAEDEAAQRVQKSEQATQRVNEVATTAQGVTPQPEPKMEKTDAEKSDDELYQELVQEGTFEKLFSPPVPDWND